VSHQRHFEIDPHPQARVALVKGHIDRRNDDPRVPPGDISPPDVTQNPNTKPITLPLPLNHCTPPLVSQLMKILVNHPGDTEVHVHLLNGSRTTVMRLGALRAAPTPALEADLKMALGPSAVL
jgi:DNA polymerase-3 subunit alpha